MSLESHEYTTKLSHHLYWSVVVVYRYIYLHGKRRLCFWLYWFVCLFVCLFVDITQKYYEQIWMKFYGEVLGGTMNI